MNLTTLDNVLQYMGMVVADADDTMQAQIQAKIAEVSARAEKYCNREFEKLERTEYHDGGGKFLFLRCRPVQSLTSVRWSLFWDFSDGGNNLDILIGLSGANFTPITGQAILYGGIDWYPGQKTIRVVYIAGWDPPPADPNSPPAGYTPIPSDMEEAICQQVVYEWRRRNDLGLRSVSQPDGTINKMDVGEWLEGVLPTMNRYRNRYTG